VQKKVLEHREKDVLLKRKKKVRLPERAEISALKRIQKGKRETSSREAAFGKGNFALRSPREGLLAYVEGRGGENGYHRPREDKERKFLKLRLMGRKRVLTGRWRVPSRETSPVTSLRR